MITTIQIHENAKRALDKLKENNESYEEVIINLMKLVESQRLKEKKLLIEGYKEMAKESLKITKEFEVIKRESDWKW